MGPFAYGTLKNITILSRHYLNEANRKQYKTMIFIFSFEGPKQGISFISCAVQIVNGYIGPSGVKKDFLEASL